MWDYVGDNYVHRLIQSKTDGKLVELNAPHCTLDSDPCGSCESKDSGLSEALLNSKVEAVMESFGLKMFFCFQSHYISCYLKYSL